jgi:hypothetical protein
MLCGNSVDLKVCWMEEVQTLSLFANFAIGGCVVSLVLAASMMIGLTI